MATEKKNSIMSLSATKPPKELKIDVASTISLIAERLSFAASWSKGDNDYSAGQKAYFRVYGWPNCPSKNEWENLYANPVSVEKDQFSIVFWEPDLSEYYPNSNSTICWVRFEVKGRRGDYTKKNVTYDPQWSTKTCRNVNIEVPPVPKVETPTDGTDKFTKNFAWSVPATSQWVGSIGSEDEKFQIYYDAVWESILVNNLTESVDTAWWTSAYNPTYLSGTIAAGTTSGTIQISESNPSWTGNYSYTRYVRMYSRGPAGNSATSAYASFTYSNNPAPSAPEASLNNGSATVSAPSTIDGSYNFDYYSIQHLISVPVTSIAETPDPEVPNRANGMVTISPPLEDDSSWVEDIKTATIGYYTFPIDSYNVEDKLIWARNVGFKNGDASKGPASRLSPYPGRLKAPSGLSVTSINPTTHRVTVTATNNSEVAASYLLILFRLSENPNDYKTYGIIPHNETNPVTVQLPDWGESQFDIGVQAMLGDYSKEYKANPGYYQYNVNKTYMYSDIIWDGGQIPIPPKEVKLNPQKSGTIEVSWDWTWEEADVAEISWADHDDAWMSTSEPQTYVINNNYNGQWNISGLSVGKWYVRVRLGKRNGDAITYSMYSAIVETTLTSAPTIPSLMITPSVITPDGRVTLTWVYSSEDGSGQKKAQIFRSNDLKTPIKTVDTDTSVVLTRNDVHWNDNERVELVINVLSQNNELSQGFSKPAAFQVTPLPSEPVISFSSGWDANTNSVTALPLSFSISGINNSDQLNILIERTLGTVVDTPWEDDYPVYPGEIAYRNTSMSGNRTVTINQKDLIQNLDNRWNYKLKVINKDSFGQTNETEVPFVVAWSHTAVEPEATIEIDRDLYIAKITPIRPSGNKYAAGDTCDIYRLSADKPQLVMSGAEMTNPPTTYVDLYPTIGEFGGYRIVYMTGNGDYRTANGYAMTNYEGDDYTINEFVSIINFGNDEVRLRYNLSVSNSWNKDFAETKYLGGAIQGDWNPAISRSGTLKATVSIQEDPTTDVPRETIEALRRLAVYSGVCFVRTPDGSSYYANVDVQEDREEKWVTRISKFSLNITRVDPPTSFEALTYTEYTDDEEDEEG